MPALSPAKFYKVTEMLLYLRWFYHQSFETLVFLKGTSDITSIL